MNLFFSKSFLLLLVFLQKLCFINGCAYGVANIKSHIPIILDLNDHNYYAWRELFLTPTGNDDAAWQKRDGLVKLWIYGTLAQPLFRSSFKPGGMARDVWLRIENQFRNNKEARAIQFDNELRTSEKGDQTIQQYCQKIKSLADLLSNVDAPVNERTLVMYLLNGLNEKYVNIINIIKHKDPFPTFDNVRSMLDMEESRLNKPRRATASHMDMSSSSTVLVATETQPQQTRNQPRNNNNYRGKKNNRFRGNRGNFNNFLPQYPIWMPPNFWRGQYKAWPQKFANWKLQHIVDPLLLQLKLSKRIWQRFSQHSFHKHIQLRCCLISQVVVGTWIPALQRISRLIQVYSILILNIISSSCSWLLSETVLNFLSLLLVQPLSLLKLDLCP